MHIFVAQDFTRPHLCSPPAQRPKEKETRGGIEAGPGRVVRSHCLPGLPAPTAVWTWQTGARCARPTRGVGSGKLVGREESLGC